jgi:hypothetical protein
MTLRLTGALLCGALLVIAVPSMSFAQLGNPTGGGKGDRLYGPGQAHYGSASRNKHIGNVKYGTTRATTVKSSKSNTSDRVKGKPTKDQRAKQ